MTRGAPDGRSRCTSSPASDVTLTLPTALPTGAGSWTVTDYRREVLTSAPAAGGVAVAYGPQLDNGEAWLIDRAVVSCTSSTATACRLYESTASPAFLLSGTASGAFDEADYPAGLLVPSGRQILAVWTGCSDGAVGTAGLQIRELRAG